MKEGSMVGLRSNNIPFRSINMVVDSLGDHADSL
jgi:hypothetical protein